jgi:hypothetical protein
MGYAVETPRHLAPSVGSRSAGVETSSASTTVRGDSPIWAGLIRFGFVDFTEHSPASRPDFDALNESIDLTFGDMNFRASRVGILRLQDSTRPQVTESTLSPTRVTTSSPSFGPRSEIESGFDSTPRAYLDLHRFVGMVHRVPRDDDRTDSESPSGSESSSDPANPTDAKNGGRMAWRNSNMKI